MSKHYEKGIVAAQEVVASVGAKPVRTERMTYGEIVSFVKGFGIKGHAIVQMADAWWADQDRAYDQGWHGHADAAYWSEW